MVVSLTCCKRADSMVKLCEVFESLKLKIITANITAVSGRLLKTVFIEVTALRPLSLLLIRNSKQTETGVCLSFSFNACSAFV